MAVKPKLPGVAGGQYKGEMTGGGGAEKFAKPAEMHSPGVTGMGGTKNDIGEKSGFEGSTASYIDKKGTPYGEDAKFNFLPPGMDITNQENCDIREMPFKSVVSVSYAGDGWE